MPAYCVECGTIVEVDLTGADLHIDEFHCGSAAAELFFLEKAATYTCPKCKAHDMCCIRASTGEPRGWEAACGRGRYCWMSTGAAGGHQLTHHEHVPVVHTHAAVADRLADEAVLVGAVDRPPARPWAQ